MQSISVFLDIANLLISGGKMLMSAELKEFFCPPPPFFSSVSSPEKAHSE